MIDWETELQIEARMFKSSPMKSTGLDLGAEQLIDVKTKRKIFDRVLPVSGSLDNEYSNLIHRRYYPRAG